MRLFKPSTAKQEANIIMNSINKIQDNSQDQKEDSQKTLFNEPSEDSSTQKTQQGTNLQKRKYNVITEELRKIIIRKIVEEKQNIKEVARDHDLKLSTTKAILQVYLNEGRIGKKAKRDKKVQIVNTLVVTTVNPLNPSASTVTPYVSITETKTNSVKVQEKKQFLVQKAIKQAADHLQNVFSRNQSDIFTIKLPNDGAEQKTLQQSFMQAQAQGLAQILFNNGGSKLIGNNNPYLNNTSNNTQLINGLSNTPTSFQYKEPQINDVFNGEIPFSIKVQPPQRNQRLLDIIPTRIQGPPKNSSFEPPIHKNIVINNIQKDEIKIKKESDSDCIYQMEANKVFRQLQQEHMTEKCIKIR